MKGIAGFVITGMLALLAALAVIWGENSVAELHLVRAATDPGSLLNVNWLRPTGP